MRCWLFGLGMLALAGTAHGQPRTPLTRALADALYCPITSCMTTTTGDARYLKIAADNDPLTGQLSLAATGVSFAGSTSGTTSLVAAAIAGTTALTLPAATDTLVGKATTDAFTNKSISLTTNTVTGTTAQFNTALSDNDFATLAGAEGLTNKTLTSPVLVTPTLGVATATSVNKVALTAPASAATLTIADGKTLTSSNSLTLAGTDATTLTFQGTDTYVARTSTDTLTNKTLTSPVVNSPSETAVNITDAALSLNGARWQSFAFVITNTTGTMQHQIFGESTTPTASSYVSKISGASVTAANTPTVDSVTAFTAGAGIQSGATATVVFNTAAQTDSKFAAICVVERNNTATAGVTTFCRNISLNINGVTQNRLALKFETSAGAAFALTTANIGAGLLIRVRVIALIE